MLWIDYGTTSQESSLEILKEACLLIIKCSSFEMLDLDTLNYFGNPLRKVLAHDSIEEEFLMISNIGFGEDRPLLRTDLFSFAGSPTRGQNARMVETKEKKKSKILFSKVDLNSNSPETLLTEEEMLLLRYTLCTSHISFVSLDFRNSDTDFGLAEISLEKIKDLINKVEIISEEIKTYVGVQPIYRFTIANEDLNLSSKFRPLIKSKKILNFPKNLDPQTLIRSELPTSQQQPTTIGKFQSFIQDIRKG